MVRLELAKLNWFNCQRDSITNYVKQKYNLDLEIVGYRRFKNHSFSDGKERVLKKTAIFENLDNGKIFLLDPFDKAESVYEMDDILKTCPEVVHVVKNQFDPTLIPPRENLTKGIYYPKNLGSYIELTKHKEPILIKDRPHGELYFAGKLWRIRKKIIPRLGEHCKITGNMKYNDFIDYNANSRITLCLPGNGDLCHREIECFGVGTPVLSPTLANELADPLIPNKHYVEVKIDLKSHPRRIANAIIKRYEEIKNDIDFLQYISYNCYEWYKRNIIEEPYKTLDVGIRKIL
jgi:hypothetical protein